MTAKTRCQACQRFARIELHSTGLWLCGRCAAWSDGHGRLNGQP